MPLDENDDPLEGREENFPLDFEKPSQFGVFVSYDQSRVWVCVNGTSLVRAKGVQGLTINKGMMQERAIEIAKMHAKRSPHAYVQVEDFICHEWVIEAILEAANG